MVRRLAALIAAAIVVSLTAAALAKPSAACVTSCNLL
jgi:hypothetical protein